MNSGMCWDFPSSVVDSCIKLMEHGDSKSIWQDFPDPSPYLPIPGGALIYLGNQVTEKMPEVPVKEDQNLTWTLKSSRLNLCYGHKGGTAFILLHCYTDRGCINCLFERSPCGLLQVAYFAIFCCKLLRCDHVLPLWMKFDEVTGVEIYFAILLWIHFSLLVPLKIDGKLCSLSPITHSFFHAYLAALGNCRGTFFGRYGSIFVVLDLSVACDTMWRQ